MITRVAGTRLLGDNLSVISLEGTDNVVVANLEPNGTIRWSQGERLVYVKEGARLPSDVMQERGYWDAEKERGFLGGKKHDQVKMRRFGPEEDRIESRGLLFKMQNGPDANNVRPHVTRGDKELDIDIEALPRDDEEVADFLGIE